MKAWAVRISYLVLLTALIGATLWFFKPAVFSNSNKPVQVATTPTNNSATKPVVASESIPAEGYSAAKPNPGAHPAGLVTKEGSKSLVGEWLYMAILFTVAIVILVGLFFVYRTWRLSALMRSPHIVTPENFARLFGNVEQALHQLAQQVASVNGSVHSQREELEKKSNDLARTFLTLQGALDQRDSQLKKAEEGWDQLVFKKFVRRFAKVDEMLHEQTNLEANELLDHVRIMLRDALEECGVEQYYPAKGSDYRKVIGIAENPETVVTSDVSKVFLISDVIVPGYSISKPDGGKTIIIPARVKIFVAEGV